MKNLSRFLPALTIAVMPFAVDAAGTYYTGGYRSPQQARYDTPTYAQRQASGTTAANPAVRYSTGAGPQVASQPSQRQQKTATTTRRGFSLGAGFSRQVAMWNFEMKDAGSILHYDNIDWNVFDAKAGYVFDLSGRPWQIAGGVQYGMQAGESTMVDDDITNGGYVIRGLYDNGTLAAYQMGDAMSIGTSKDGDMLGLNIGFGPQDFFRMGNLRITPTIGWRYLKYKLKTQSNYGLAVEHVQCFDVDGELRCDPILIFYNSANQPLDIQLRNSLDTSVLVPDGANSVSTEGTYYFAQSGVSHSYEVEWSGPYVALDMDYAINQNNIVDARVELGLPSYTATGDQPYRFDWQHPKSVEDEGGIGDAWHLGLGANWSTAVTDAITLSLGVTYDYYSVSGAKAKTYFNSKYYEDIWNALLTGYASVDDMLANNETAQGIQEIREACPGWVCDSGKVDSYYKSMGIRVGINAKF